MLLLEAGSSKVVKVESSVITVTGSICSHLPRVGDGESRTTEQKASHAQLQVWAEVQRE